jgi:prepilin-type N-terminal cleavage/methylation domain-containing protein
MRARTAQRGFTLVELLVALALMARCPGLVLRPAIPGPRCCTGAKSRRLAASDAAQERRNRMGRFDLA